jgi:hypothetical protein
MLMHIFSFVLVSALILFYIVVGIVQSSKFDLKIKLLCKLEKHLKNRKYFLFLSRFG